MTVHQCVRCSERHDRLTTISSIGAIYYDKSTGPEITTVGLFGCPQCATNCCATYAVETDGICECGGELVPGVMYQFSGDGRLPSEIAALRSTEERLHALEERRRRVPMIMAQYHQYRKLIKRCEQIAESGVDLPDNPGLAELKARSDRYGLAPIEAWGLLQDYAVSNNALQMVKILDERCLRHVKDYLSTYPTSENDWSQLLEDYSAPEHHPEHLIPRESAVEMYQRTREFVTVLRHAVEQHKKRI